VTPKVVTTEDATNFIVHHSGNWTVFVLRHNNPATVIEIQAIGITVMV
jgi:hypothetical protein